MTNSETPLRIFVAMPGNLGPSSRYGNPESVKKNFFDKIVERLIRELGRKVELYIEKDKDTTGDIHASMFSEAVDADIYFADLTNANPNVYLELGVRWALRDGLTIPIYQNTDDLRFNVGSTRAFLYNPDNINERISTIVDMIKKYIISPWSDSPIRERMDIVSLRKADLEALNAEVHRLQHARGEEFFKAAMAASVPSDRIRLLEHAVAANPAYTAAFIQLGTSYRLGSAYDDSEKALIAARRLEPNNSVIHRELGVTYSKSNRIDEAVRSLREAVNIDPRDPEAWSNLGGALRRAAMKNPLDGNAVISLREARECYSKAEALNPYNLYAALNVCRLDLALSRWEPTKFQDAVDGFTSRLPLCQYEASRKPDDSWLQFDLAEALLFAGRLQESKATYSMVTGKLLPEQRDDILRSVRGPLEGYLLLGGVPGSMKTQVQEILTILS
jgi:tetratricopeptide (TPR) repeat protein